MGICNSSESTATNNQQGHKDKGQKDQGHKDQGQTRQEVRKDQGQKGQGQKTYKLTYFNIRGRGETTRLLFTVADVPFADDRIEFSDWPAKKKDFKLGTLPVLYENNEECQQSMAIARHVARTFGLYGNNLDETRIIDMVLEVCVDIEIAFAKIPFEKDETKKAEAKEKLLKEVLPKNLSFLDEQLESSLTGFISGGKLSIADLMVYNVVESCKNMFGNQYQFDQHSNLERMLKKVAEQPRIKAWLAKRPTTAI